MVYVLAVLDEDEREDHGGRFVADPVQAAFAELHEMCCKSLKIDNCSRKRSVPPVNCGMGVYGGQLMFRGGGVCLHATFTMALAESES